MGLGRTVVSDEEDEIGEEDMREVADGDAVDGDRDEDDDEEDDEEGQDEYEKDGFIVDEVDEDDQDDEEERASSDEEKQKKKKRKKRESEKNYVLDEDDYELLQDNNVGGFQRPKPGSKKFKRLKKAGRDSEQDHSGFSDDEILDKTGRSGRTAEEKLKRSLFGDEEGPGAHLEDIGDEEDPVVEEDDIDEDNEMADFIVSSPERDENGAPVRRRKASKKKQRQTPGVSSSALQEAHDIFGDVDELLMMRKKGLAKGARLDDSGDLKEKRLEDEFEPFILKEKYMTEKDDRIRDIDVPERIQVLEESTGPAPVDPVSIEDESGWILSQLSANMDSLFGNKFFAGLTDEERLEQTKRTKEDIVRLLDMMHVQKLDIPFIAMYRRELCSTLLNVADQEEETPPETENEDKDTDKDTRKLKWHKVLWAIKDLDRKWLLLQKRKNALQLYYNKRFEEESRNIYDETRLNLNRQLFESISDSLKNAESEREVDDVDSKFNLHFPPGEVGVDEGQFKRPKRKSHYSTCHKAGLWDMATKIGYSSEQFGLLLTLEKMRIEELEDAKEIPEEIAATYTCAMFETPQEVLKGARHMAAVEISCEPRVRKHVRNIFMEYAVVSTKPTPEGNGVIDSFHQFAGIKWLREKPLTKFEDAQWLLIQKAEEEKLLQVTIKLPENNLNQLMGDCNDNYLSDGVSKPAKLWNDQRKLILQDTFSNFLLPSMEKEARSILTARAKNWLLMEYGKHLWDKVSVAPWQRKETDNVSDEEVAPRVMACCWGPGKPATTFVMLDSSGEVLDVLYTGSLTSRSQNVNDQQRKKNDESRVLKFIIDHQPHVAVLGAVNLNCTRLKEELFEIIFKMIEEYPREIGHEMEDLPVVYADESLPRLYENSRISSDQLPGQSGIVKRAVALGRFIQNPLAMVATLCGPAREILSWKLGSLEHFLSPDEKYDMIEQVMVDVTNQVGIDINLAASHEWLFSPLQFVSGLGPRKAASLQRALVRTGAITTRKDLTSKASLKKRVFINAAGFLRVRRSGLATNSSQIIDLLDDTRIHPESYELAKTMAKDVFDEDPQDDNDPDEDAQEMAIEHVREKPNYLRALDINAYAKDVEKRFSAINKKETLFDIKMELLNGFRDWRNPYREPNQIEEFYMISGESEDTLAEGRIVQVTVRRVQPQRAICVLESGLTGWVMSEDYSDTNRQVDMTEEISEGDILTCKIRSIQTNRYQVYLTCKESELKRDRYDTSENRDTYYKPDESNVQSEQEKARKEKDAKKYLKSRMIVHPRFQNITADEAIEFLSDKEAGESIIRPSSRGPAFLTLTLKVYDGIYAHKDIVEGGKDHKDITSWLRLGKTLKIGDDTFEDLDEVMDRYVDPLVAHLKSMLGYRKFKRGTKAEVDDLLRIEKTDYPMRIVYCFGISHEHPGTFILSYIRSTNPHHEYIGLYPKGFKFRKRTFEDIDRLVAYFQKHIDDMQHDSGPSIRSVAAMVPMKSPANGGSSGGGGWGGSTTNSNDGGGGWGGGQSDWDKERSSTPGSRAGRNDYRSGGGRDGHPSGLPRPYGGSGGGSGGGGRGRGRGSYNGGGRGNNNNNERRDTGYNSSSKWGSSGSKDGGEEGWNSFPGAKVQNSPGREAFPGGWSGGGGNFPGDKVQNSPGREAFPGGWGSTGSGSGGGGGASGGGWGGSSGGGGGWGEDKGSGGAGGDGGWGSASKGGGDSTPGNLGWGGGGGGGGGSGSSSKKDDGGKGWSDGGGGW